MPAAPSDGAPQTAIDFGKAVAKKVKLAKKPVAIKPRGAGTLAAKPLSFGARVAAFAKSGGDPGFKPPSSESYWPFGNKTESDRYSKYDTLARSFIYISLQYRGKGVIISGNQGTAPELALLGAHLATGNFHLGRNLFHQSVPLYGLRARGRPFVVDVAAQYGGVLFLYPVDGAYFHLKSMMEVLDSQRRNWLLEGVGGRVVPVIDTQCYSGMGMIAFLRSEGAPI